MRAVVFEEPDRRARRGCLRLGGRRSRDRPFVCACGTCARCAAGDQQICDREFQPGATAVASASRQSCWPSPPAQGIAPIPMHRVIGGELEIVGIHGLQAHEYPEMLRVVETAGIDLAGMIGKRIGLDDVPSVLAEMNNPVPAQAGVTVVEFPNGDSR